VTNATKAMLIAVINAGLGLAVSFGVEVSPEQMGAILAFVNAALALVVGLTYKSSAKRIPDGGYAFTPGWEDEPDA
jgi:hypothetical protein